MSDSQLEFIANQLQINQDKSIQLINFSEIFIKIKQTLQKSFNSELLNKLFKIGFNGTFTATFEQICPQPTIEDGGQLLQFFATPQSVNKVRYSVSQIEKEFNIELFEEAMDWKIVDVFQYLKSKGITVIQCIQNMKMDEIYYSPQQLLELTIKALLAQNQRTCFCSKCSNEQKESLIDLIFGGFELNKFVKFTYLIGFLTLAQTLTRAFNTKVYLQLKQGLSQETLKQFLLLQQYAFYVNFGRLETVQLIYPPNLTNNEFSCPFQYALDICGNILDQKFGENSSKRNCSFSQQYLISDLDQLMLNQQQAVVLTQAFVWRCIPLIKTLKLLYEDFSPQIEYLLHINMPNQTQLQLSQELTQKGYGDPTAKCAEQLALTILQLQPSYFLKSILALALNKYYNKSTKTVLNPILTQSLIQSEYFSYIYQVVWQFQPALTSKMLEHAIEYQCLDLVLISEDNFYFTLDVGSIAAQQNKISMTTFLNGQLMKIGVSFAEALCVFIVKKVYKYLQIQNKNLELSDFHYLHSDYTPSISCALHDIIQLSQQNTQSVSLETQLRFVTVSDIQPNEDVVYSFYRTLVYYEGYFKNISQQELQSRMTKLFSAAISIIKLAYPKIDMVMAQDLQVTDQITSQNASNQFSQLCINKNYQQFVEEQKTILKQQQTLKSVSFVLLNLIINGINDIKVIQQHNKDLNQEQLIQTQQELHILSAELFINSLFFDVLHPKFLNVLLLIASSKSQSDLSLSKLLIKTIILSVKKIKQTTKVINSSTTYFSFFESLSMLDAFQQVDLDTQQYAFILTQQCTFKQSLILQNIQNEVKLRKDSNNKLLQNADKLLQSNFLDEEIAQLLRKNKSLMVLLPSSQQETGVYYEIYQQKLQLILSQSAINESVRQQQIKECKLIFENDKQQFAEFFVTNWIIQFQVKNSDQQNMPLALFFQFFITLDSPELLFLITKQCILTVSRLLYSVQTLTSEQLIQRRQKVFQLATWLGASQFRLEFAPLKGLRIEDFDYLALSKIAETCETKPILTQFFSQFSRTILQMSQIITSQNGYLLTLLSITIDMIKCEHGFFCKNCRESAKIANENIQNLEQYLLYSDIDSVVNEFYSEEIHELTGETVNKQNKKYIILPEILQQEENLSLLMKAEVNEVPLNLTSALIQENQELLWNYDSVQICYRQGRIQQIWSKYVDNARECAEALLNNFGLKQTDSRYKKAFSMCTNRITSVLIRNASLSAFSQEILQEILNRFQYEEYVPLQLQELITSKILKQLSLMAAEQVILYVQKQAQQLQQIKISNNNKLNYKFDFQLAETYDMEETTTPFDDRAIHNGSNELSFDEQVNRLVDDFYHIFSIKSNHHDKNTWIEVTQHDNTAIYPYTMINYPELLICCNWMQQPQISQNQVQAQQFLSKQLGTSNDLSIQEQLQQFISRYQFTSTLHKNQVIKFIYNQGATINYLSNYLPLSKSLSQDDSIKLLARLCKSIYSSQNQLAQSSYSSSKISMYNIQTNHPLNAQLHSLRIVFDYMWRINPNNCKSFMTALFNWTFSGITFDSNTINQIKSCQINYDDYQKGAKEGQLKSINFTTDFKIAEQLQANISSYQVKAKNEFLSLFPPDSKIHDYFKEEHQQIVRHICSTPASCSNQISILKSLPFAIYQVLYRVFQDNSSSAIELKQQIQVGFQQIIDLSVYSDILNLHDSKYYSVHDCLSGYYIGIIQNHVLKPEDADRLFYDTIQQAILYPLSFTNNSEIPPVAVQNKCVLTITAAAETLCEVCFNNTKELAQCHKSISSYLFKQTVQLIEELYVSSMETLAATVNTTQDISIYSTSLELPDIIQEFLFYQQHINQGFLAQRNFSGDNLCDFGFQLKYSDFITGQQISVKLSEIEDSVKKFAKYVNVEVQKKSQNSFTMLDNHIMECFKQFSAIVDDKINLTQQQIPLISSCVFQIHQVGLMLSDDVASQIFDSLLISTFYTIYNDCDYKALIINKKSVQIDQLGQFFYYLIQSIPEFEVRGKQKEQYLALLLYRIQQLYSVFQSIQICPLTKIQIMKQLRNYDLVQKSVQQTPITIQTICQLQSEQRLIEQIDNGEQLPQQTFFNILAMKFTHKLLFTIQRIFLSQTTRFNRYHRIQFSTIIAQSLYAYRPQYHPEFFAIFMSLMSEPTLQGAMLHYQPDYSFNQYYTKSQNLNFLKHMFYENSPTFQPYFMLLQAFCNYTHSYFQNIQLTNQPYLKQYIRCLMRLIIIISNDFPIFMNKYRLIISESLHQNAQQLRGQLNSRKNYPKTDEVNGMLAIPETDFIEDLIMADINKDLEMVLKKDSDHYVKDVVASLKHTVFNPLKIDQIAPFLNYLVKYHFYTQLDRKKVEETYCFQIIYQLLRDLAPQDSARWVVVQMSIFASGPSIETYCFSAILQALARCTFSNVQLLVREVIDKRHKDGTNWGCNILARSLQRKGWK
eukprot:EST45168.1 Hypothetical protein SS50377_14741 [Spironucleus salmonicida]